MPSFVTDALVLRTYALGETSKVVVLLTRERGKQRAVARGARGSRSRYQSALEPLSEVRVSLSGRQAAELLTLGQCELVRSAFRLGERGIDATLAASYFVELLDAFAQEGEAEDAVYRLALAVIAATGAGVSPELLERYLEAWLLRLHGLYPQLDRCASCALPLPAGERRYHASARGFICAGCGYASGPVLPDAARGFLFELFRTPPHALCGACPEPALVRTFQQDLIERHLERPLRSERVRRGVTRTIAGMNP